MSTAVEVIIAVIVFLLAVVSVAGLAAGVESYLRRPPLLRRVPSTSGRRVLHR